MNVVGVWKLLSLVIEDGQTGKIVRPWGEKPVGRITYTKSGHMSAVIAADNRKPLDSKESAQEDRAQLYSTFTAYSGTYSINGETFTHYVDVSSDPSWMGTEQTRLAKLDNNTLTLTTPVLLAPDGKWYKNTLTWTRAE